MSDLLQDVVKEQLRESTPDFSPGDTIRVSYRIREGEKERIQAFEGVCIKRRGGGVAETFTVRKISSGIGVERVFPLHAPTVEGIQVIRSLLDNEVTNFSGEYFTVTDAWCQPKPVQEKLPLIIGGKGPKRTLLAVAKWADQWDMTFPDDVGHWQGLDEVLRRHCDDVGRDQSEITRSIHLGYGPDDDVGELASRAETFFDAGVDLVVWSMRGPIAPARLAPLADAVS